MLIEEAKRRQEELKKYLFDMASACLNEQEIRQIAIKLKALYSSNFRHNYSDFFSMIVEMSKDNNPYSLDYLSNNLEGLRQMVENDYVVGEKEFYGLYQPLTKLSDHVNLEIGRFSYYSISEQKVQDLEKKNRTLQIELKQATADLEAAQKKVVSVQTELISVLSIFAAIVLSLSGSISFVGNTLSGVADSPFFKIVFMSLLCGFVVFNLIFVMLYIVSKLTDRNIYARCQSENCTCGENKTPKCNGLQRIRKRFPYVFWMNISLLLLMILDIVAWCLNMNCWLLPF